MALLVRSGSNCVSTNRITAGVVCGRSQLLGQSRSLGSCAGGSTVTSISRNREVSDIISSENCSRAAIQIPDVTREALDFAEIMGRNKDRRIGCAVQ